MVEVQRLQIVFGHLFDGFDIFQVGVGQPESHAEKFQPRGQHLRTGFQGVFDFVDKVVVFVFQQFDRVGKGADVADQVMADPGADQFRNVDFVFHFAS